MTELQLQNNSLFLIRTGSHLYGTSRPESDIDFAGVFMPLPEHVLGLRTVNDVDLSVTVKGEDGRNTGEAVDYVYHDLRKYVRALIKGSPNFLEMLYAQGDSLVQVSPAGERLRLHRGMFLHTGLHERFLGYAASQLKKMYLRTRDRGPLREAVEALAGEALRHTRTRFTVADLREEGRQIPYVTYEDGQMRVGDGSSQGSVFLDHVKVNDVVKRMRRAIQLAEMDERTFGPLGYDLKYGSHLIRLLYEGRELLLEGGLTFPLRQAPELRAIREGAWTSTEVESRSEELIDEIGEIVQSGRSVLPAELDVDAIDRLVQSMVFEHMRTTGFEPAPLFYPITQPPTP